MTSGPRAPAGGSQILLDVPKELADSGWIVAAFTSDGKTNTVLRPTNQLTTWLLGGQLRQ